MGSKYLCLDCGEIYNSSNLNIDRLFEDIICPKTNCCGILVEIDELLIPTIKILNKKGYYTKSCCSGHYTEQHPRTYILFHEGINIPFIPKGFTRGVINNCILIEFESESEKPTFKDFYEICDNAKILLKWSKSYHMLKNKTKGGMSYRTFNKNSRMV